MVDALCESEAAGGDGRGGAVGESEAAGGDSRESKEAERASQRPSDSDQTFSL